MRLNLTSVLLLSSQCSYWLYDDDIFKGVVGIQTNICTEEDSLWSLVIAGLYLENCSLTFKHFEFLY